MGVRLGDIRGGNTSSSTAHSADASASQQDDTDTWVSEAAHIVNTTISKHRRTLIVVFTFGAAEEDEVLPPADVEGRITLLCAEDNPVNQRFLHVFLSRHNQDHEMTDNGLDVVDACMAEPERFRCILMDITLPDINGIEATRRIRAFEDTRRDLRRAVIVGLTVHSALSPHLSLSAGAFDLFDALVTKPFSLGTVGQMLFGGPDTNLVALHGSLTPQEMRQYPLRQRDSRLFGDSPRERAVVEELRRMKERMNGQINERRERFNDYQVNVRIRVIKKEKMAS
ncbi:Uu.00g146570.m01.CDS01 [Anthostomella pinea]|uniref:Uu.00g146570.m01.CDS01 n=1 Tax=Anthostomella pinea TaxID=933095 RepID=A0AAI8YJK0_9PEZI|nr:Uu.00g146570.m01.CDS01 [Anthostomella pinea]